ncbi:hypothetical protein Tco_1124915 [Tanacetum coccineum]|uniref:Uncharacterized protein n=1 Tax=Tanacetum coccineum TaxID=301880 RepID=A0ABQ5J8Z5_9ASTR
MLAITPPSIAERVCAVYTVRFQQSYCGIKRLHDDLEDTAAKLMLMVYKLLLLVLEVNAASTKVINAQRLRLLKEFLLSRDG